MSGDAAMWPSLRTAVVGGADYLRLATRLLQQIRLRSAEGGIWEAADVQWWSRQERPTDSYGQLFWLDEQGEPVAAVIVTDFFHDVQCDVLILPDQGTPQRSLPAAEIWHRALGRVRTLGITAEFPVRSDDAVGTAELTAAGYRPASQDGVVATWLAAADRPRVPALAAGYRLVSRADDVRLPHPLARRNGAEAEERLRRCSLYLPELDLSVEAPDGTIAGYGLFWADPVTRVGLVEPMRTEAEHQRCGIAAHILASGLDRLAVRGCGRLKVSNDIGLYLRAGFEPLRTARLLSYALPG